MPPNQPFGLPAEPFATDAADNSAGLARRILVGITATASKSTLALFSATTAAPGGGMVEQGGPAVRRLSVTVAQHARTVRLEAAGGVSVRGQLHVASKMVKKN